MFDGDVNEKQQVAMKKTAIETANQPHPMRPLSNYNDMDRCMSETAHLDDMSSFMSLFDDEGSGRMISPEDSYNKITGEPNVNMNALMPPSMFRSSMNPSAMHLNMPTAGQKLIPSAGQRKRS